MVRFSRPVAYNLSSEPNVCSRRRGVSSRIQFNWNAACHKVPVSVHRSLSELHELICRHGIMVHNFADDTQLYIQT